MTFKYLLAVVLLFISSTAVRGQVDLNDVMPGDVIDNNTMIPDGAVINLNGGSVASGTVLSAADFPNGVELNINSGDVGLGVEINNSTINIFNGQVALGATDLSEGVNNFNNQITVTGGDVGGFFQLRGSSELLLLGGRVESFGTLTNASATVEGGSFVLVDNNGELNLSGGQFNAFRSLGNSTVNLFGSDFAIDGNPITGLSDGVAVNIASQLAGQDVTFSGILSDGSAFSTLIAETSNNFGPFGPGELEAVPGFVSGGATVNVTLVESIPEPSSSVLFVLASCVGLVRRRR